MKTPETKNQNIKKQKTRVPKKLCNTDKAAIPVQQTDTKDHHTSEELLCKRRCIHAIATEAIRQQAWAWVRHADNPIGSVQTVQVRAQECEDRLH